MNAPGVSLTGTLRFPGFASLSGLHLDLPPARWTCLLGPSGAGKSTLLRLMANLPTGGKFDGRVQTSDDKPLTGRFAYMGQSDLLADWLDVRGNVALGPALRGEEPDIARRDEMIERVGLTPHANKHPPELSGGMRQRVALARTLMEDRPVALLDEPFSALDARTRAEMQELAFETLAGRTVLIVTHDPAEAVRLGHAIYLMSTDSLRPLDVPDLAPIRPAGDPQTLSAQAALLATLRETV